VSVKTFKIFQEYQSLSSSTQSTFDLSKGSSRDHHSQNLEGIFLKKSTGKKEQPGTGQHSSLIMIKFIPFCTHVMWLLLYSFFVSTYRRAEEIPFQKLPHPFTFIQTLLSITKIPRDRYRNMWCTTNSSPIRFVPCLSSSSLLSLSLSRCLSERRHDLHVWSHDNQSLLDP
jgi:hypothetical protein